ncbi:hypothetical protein Q6A78_01520 [Aliarcobacter skirrowii]|uniref:hypothetical protein n=1 Tax=Aliarcobacter skirrowii TaxID=28200 RepID=UPI0029BF070D|nr:hypothetical protein [Aliarcobacter skirrowii]MDX3959076.1 hypothetical protein [Aliarcobacter skirrowii]
MTQENNSKANIENSTFTPPHPLKTAVLFLVFNRLDTTKQVFQAIREAKPPRLYIAADGARESKEGEAEKVKAVRDYILQNIDWDCEVKTLFREQNFGCKMAVSSAITWFFENEEMGIILEDDCLPSQSFFWFCEELLDRYKDEKKIFMITGTSYLFNEIKSEDNYFFSKYMSIWGWCTWKDRWNNYDLNMSNFPEIKQKGLIDSYFHWDENVKNIFMSYYEMAYGKKIDTWDFQWIYKCAEKNGLCLTPYLNLVSNIGIEGTRDGSDSPFINMQRQEIILGDNKKIEISQNFAIDKILFQNVFYRFEKFVVIKGVLKKLKLYNFIKLIYKLFR